MSIFKKLTDAFTDALQLSKFATDRSLVKKFAGASITREDYQAYSKNGLVDEYFGHIKLDSATYYGLDYSFTFEDAKRLSHYQLATDILSYLKEADVIIDLDDPKNKKTKDILVNGISSFILKNDRPPNLLEPYCDHPDLRALLDFGHAKQQEAEGEPRISFGRLSKEDLDNLASEGIGF